MPQLIKKVEGQSYMVYQGNVYTLAPISGVVQVEDYVNLNGFVAFLQNFTKAEYTEALIIPSRFGLKNKYNIEVVTLKIDY